MAGGDDGMEGRWGCVRWASDLRDLHFFDFRLYSGVADEGGP